MLVLSRKAGEGFLIGDDIIIKIIEAKGGAIRIGIEAPRDRKIYRQEVYDKIKEQNVAAAHWESLDLDALSSKIVTRKK
ncbi:carbon storage regulator CsrA [Desulfofustis glycolicus]|uniref:Translational regulator CsrA n=1 Tax=Desulfofustis glycolicus DSM 9705 TaxID=1121409 RepID=A0A1M5U016_9BACT|nr:carbon storage regulator CsrA [Desulfofustis glycolicus]MCB2214734.1 carbon storage regulator CsrA [Desulfobulbaceae bacterium]SHH56349.1 carbon storage regulator, CsrA [Desulfofustis glycolicus DSM 9705]